MENHIHIIYMTPLNWWKKFIVMLITFHTQSGFMLILAKYPLPIFV